MKKISLFFLMVFSVFVLFAQEAPKEEAKNEVKEEVKAEPAAEAKPADAAPEAQQPAEAAQQPAEAAPESAVKEQPEEGSAPEAAAEEPKPVEQAGEEAPKQEEQAEEEVVDAGDKTEEQAGAEAAEEREAVVINKTKAQKIRYERPYLGVGIPLVVLGSLSVAVLMPAMGTMAFAASDACEGKDWGFCTELHENNKSHHTAWTVGAVMTGVVGAGMIVTGSWLITIKKPRENQKIELSNAAVLPTKDGMFASLGFKF